MPAAVKHLIVTSARALPASTVSSCVSAYGLDPDAAIVLTNCALAPDGTFAGALAAPQSVDKLVSLADDPETWHAPAVLKAVATSLRAGGSFVAATLASSGAVADADATRAATVAKCLVAGLVVPSDSKNTPAASGVVACVSAQKPEWKKGAAFSLKSRAVKENVSPAENSNSWKVLNTAEDDLMDDDDLLDESELRLGADEAAAAKAKGGCATSKTACANCSCGRAEAEAAAGTDGTLSEEQKKEFKSACGNCYLGDAFRCAGCPMLGQPAGKPAGAPAGSTKVTVDLGGDDF
uniref:Anamorsin homolog n=1 Tax=Micromonas pusilla TaxID=38833 RepID=A0A7S0D3G6_MICPS|mmetsp:Transcript_3075/g.12792  ORF Transcript_3075/g.12792 Transcript_3075/m.12792 type:complete len:294 (+) Transcript_3075:171-1052(+)